MRTTKSLSILFASLLFMASLAGCGGGGGSTASATAANPPTSDGSGSTTTPPATTPTTTGSGSGTSTSTKSVVLAWNPPNATGTSSAAVAGYKVYYGTSSGNYTQSVNIGAATTYTVSGLLPGTYYFNVTDYDSSGNESGFANEVSATIS